MEYNFKRQVAAWRTQDKKWMIYPPDGKRTWKIHYKLENGNYIPLEEYIKENKLDLVEIIDFKNLQEITKFICYISNTPEEKLRPLTGSVINWVYQPKCAFYSFCKYNTKNEWRVKVSIDFNEKFYANSSKRSSMEAELQFMTEKLDGVVFKTREEGAKYVKTLVDLYEFV